jgi:hypothetical protein
MSMAVLDPKCVIAHGDRQASCQIDDETVVMSLEHHEFYALNPTASAVWQLTEVPRPMSEVVDDLVVRYAIDRQTCSDEVGALVERLAHRGVVVLTPAPPGLASEASR